MQRLAISSVELSANGKMYKQLDGVALGLALAPKLANIFVGFEEAVLLEKMSRLFFYFRYVDDCFAVFKTKMKVPNFIATSTKCT